MANRTTQVVVETVAVGNKARASRVAVETVVLGNRARAGQVAVETVISPIIRANHRGQFIQ